MAPKGGRKRGSSDAVVAARVEEVLLLRLNGAEFHDLRAHASAKEWDVTERTLWRYVEASDKLLAESFEADREKALRRHVAQRRSLFARALQDGDTRTALAVAKDEAELMGLYPARNVKVAGDRDNPIVIGAFNDEDRVKAVAKILERYMGEQFAQGGPGCDSEIGDEAGDPV